MDLISDSDSVVDLLDSDSDDSSAAGPAGPAPPVPTGPPPTGHDDDMLADMPASAIIELRSQDRLGFVRLLLAAESGAPTLCPPLTYGLARRIAWACSAGPADQVVSHISDKIPVPVAREDLATLRPGQWLNDSVVNGFAACLRPSARAHSMWVLNSFFLPLLLAHDSYAYDRVQRWARKAGVAVSTLRSIAVPVNVGNMHWTLALADIPARHIMYFDSLGGQLPKEMRALGRYIDDALADEAGTPAELAGRDWEISYPRVPQQANGHDCGVFALCTLHCLVGAAKRGHAPPEWAHHGGMMRAARTAILARLLYSGTEFQA